MHCYSQSQPFLKPIRSSLMLLSETIVQPSIPSKSTQWKMTSIDKLTMDFGYALGTCWVFADRLDPDVIQNSLSTLLNEYRPFAGRYDANNRCIVLNDEGVKFQFVQDFEYSLEQVQREHFQEEFSGRFIDESSSILGMRFRNQPLMTVRLTLLRDAGCVLGVRATHGVCDGDTFYSMMHRWATISQTMLASPAAVEFDQSQIPSTNKRDARQVQLAVKESGWQMMSSLSAAYRLCAMSFHGIVGLHTKKRTPNYSLSSSAMQNMKRVADWDGQRRGLNLHALTSNEALCSFLCQLMARVFDFQNEEPCAHSTMFNWRGRLPGVSLGFGGNASSAIATSHFFAGSPLGVIAAEMNAGLNQYKSNPSFVEKQIELFLQCHEHGVNAHVVDPATLPYLTPTPRTCVTNNFARYPIYDVAFGKDGSRPLLVVPHHCGDQVLIWPSREGGGGVELYFQGTTAQCINAFDANEKEWFLRELHKFDTLSDSDPFQVEDKSFQKERPNLVQVSQRPKHL